jgi:hypothetical protein
LFAPVVSEARREWIRELPNNIDETGENIFSQQPRTVRKNEFAQFMTKTGMDTLKSSVNLRVTGWITVTRSNNP